MRFIYIHHLVRWSVITLVSIPQVKALRTPIWMRMSNIKTMKREMKNECITLIFSCVLDTVDIVTERADNVSKSVRNRFIQ